MKRSRRACEHCHARKVRCNVDHGVPCYNCVTDGKACSIPERKRSRNNAGARSPKQTQGSDEITDQPQQGPVQSLQKTESELADLFKRALVSRLHHVEWLCSQPDTTTNSLSRRIMLIERDYVLATFRACLSALKEETIYIDAEREIHDSVASNEMNRSSLNNTPLGDEQWMILQKILLLPLFRLPPNNSTGASASSTHESGSSNRCSETGSRSPLDSSSPDDPLTYESVSVVMDSLPTSDVVDGGSVKEHIDLNGWSANQEAKSATPMSTKLHDLPTATLDDLFLLLVQSPHTESQIEREYVDE